MMLSMGLTNISGRRRKTSNRERSQIANLITVLVTA
jgi:hypothetical protein